MAESRSALGQRVMTALVILPLFAVLIWVDVLRPIFSAGVVLLAAIGLSEFYAMAERRQVAPETTIGLLAGIAVTAGASWGRASVLAPLLYAAFFLVSLRHILRDRFCLAGLAVSIFGIVYVNWFAAHVILLHGTPRIGPGLVTFLIVAVGLTDAGAYGVGSTWGRHKMAPAVSPNKTWEGAVGGFLLTLAGALVFAALGAGLLRGWLPEWTLARWLGTAAVLSVAAQVGDLTESCLKRSAGVKDAGTLFPGHGGALDRCDGYLFAAPILYYIAVPFSAG